MDGPGTGNLMTHDVRLTTVYTIGHSTRPQSELIDLLNEFGVRTLIDVRTVPRSRRNPQFNKDELTVALPAAGINYVHLARLGGLRKGFGAESPNMGWRNESFRGYADYMQTDDFQEGLDELFALMADGPVALMCAEAVPWRCHRSLIADALLVRDISSEDIQGASKTIPHKLTPFAVVDGTRITYPAEEVEEASSRGGERPENGKRKPQSP
jgi:uncharacterized protein (DUF488 family)